MTNNFTISLKHHCMIETTDHKGRVFNRFFVARDPARGPGWYVWGRNEEYGDKLIKVCAMPISKPRKHPHYNCLVNSGWKRQCDANDLAVLLNAGF